MGADACWPDEELVRGKTVGIDATTLEANAAMRHRAEGQRCRATRSSSTGWPRPSGIETPTREDLARIDRKRKNKASNDDWHNPHDPDAKIAKMKDGSTHLAHKQEHAVDMESGAVLAVTIQGPTRGTRRPGGRRWKRRTRTSMRWRRTRRRPNTCTTMRWRNWWRTRGITRTRRWRTIAELGIRSYVSEPERGRRDWEGKVTEQGRGVRQPPTDSGPARQAADDVSEGS